jgi:uncharacterized cupin superfamily protein
VKISPTQRNILLLTFAIVAVLAAVVAVKLPSAWAGYVFFKEKVAQRETIVLTPSPIPPDWILSGSPTFRSNTFGRSHDQSTSSGIWECIGPTEFVWHYGTDETISILEGSAEIDYLGKKYSINAGDTTHFAAGTTARWTVRERIKKTWVLYDPGRLTRLLRRLLA